MDMVAERSGHLILSSESAEKDFRKFYPQYHSVQTHVLRFVPYVQQEDLVYQHKILEQSRVGEEFFYLPNQFWTHKNHSVVIEALHMLPKEVKVICTGNLNDYRNGTHIEMLLDRVKQLGLEDRFIVLGLVDRRKAMSLMAEALAVINPSLFEGWSTTVEESKYTGKKIILSDLPVHREQAPTDAIYFSAHEPAALAEAMMQIWHQKEDEKQQAVKRFTSARINLTDNKATFAEKYQAIITDILEKN
jgi:glycosyltransferase involved in cell wall biosynthesis